MLKDETVLKVAEALTELHKEQLGFRKILFRFLRENILDTKKIDWSVWKKLQNGYGADLTDVRMSDLVQKIILWKETKKEVCEGCVIVMNCSEMCQKLLEGYANLHTKKHSKEFK